MWSKKNANDVKLLLAKFKTDAHHVVPAFKSYCENKGRLKLFEKMRSKFGNGVRGWESLEMAAAHQVCKCCNDVILPEICRVCSSCFKTPKGKEISRAIKAASMLTSFQENYGVDHHMLLDTYALKASRKQLKAHRLRGPEIRAKRQATCLARYGADHIWKSEEGQAKRRNSLLKKYGVINPSQNVELRHKASVSSGQTKRLNFGGRIWDCQGYEPMVIPKLIAKFGKANVVSQFDKDFSPIVVETAKGDSVYCPDFYVRSNQTYVEVKSVYTLLGKRGLRDYFKLNTALAKRLAEKGVKIKMVVSNGKAKTLTLPKEWYTWPRHTLQNFILERNSHASY